MSNDNQQDVVHLEPADYPTTLRISEALRRFVNFAGANASWLLVPMLNSQI